MEDEPISKNIRTMFHTFVHDEKIKHLKNAWGFFVVLLIAISFVLTFAVYQIHYCKEHHKRLTIKQCVYKITK